MIITNCISHRPQHTRLKFQLKVWPEKFILFLKANLMIAVLNNLEIQSGIKLFRHPERERCCSIHYIYFSLIWGSTLYCITIYWNIFIIRMLRRSVESNFTPGVSSPADPSTQQVPRQSRLRFPFGIPAGPQHSELKQAQTKIDKFM